MSPRPSRALRIVLGLALLAAALFVAPSFTGQEISIVSDADAVCLAPICGPTDPPVVCSNGHWYRNRCVAAAACQYNCKGRIEIAD